MSELFPTKTTAIEVLACTDATRESEFNRWYDKVYIPEVKQTMGIIGIHRYRDMQPDYTDLGAPGLRRMWKDQGNRYLTIYRINSDDPWGLMQKVKQEDQKRTGWEKMQSCTKTYEFTVWDFIALRKSISSLQRPETRLPDGMPEAILLVPYSYSPDPVRKLEEDDWWLNTHAHDLLETPGLVQCHRYRSLNPNPSEKEATSLNIYEIDSDDPVAVVRRILQDDRDVRRPQGRFLADSPATSPTPPVISYGHGVFQHWDLM